MSQPEYEEVVIELFVAHEECGSCGELHMVCVMVSEDSCVCKKCFDRLYEQAVENRKHQIRGN